MCTCIHVERCVARPALRTLQLRAQRTEPLKMTRRECFSCPLLLRAGCWIFVCCMPRSGACLVQRTSATMMSASLYAVVAWVLVVTVRRGVSL